MRRILLVVAMSFSAVLAAQTKADSPSKAYGEFLSKTSPSVVFASTPGAFAISEGGRSTALCVDDKDWPGVRRAVADLSADIAEVSGAKPELACRGAQQIILGTLGRSAAIDSLVAKKRIDVSDIAGKWEATKSFLVDRPTPGVARALVIVGSDKRGSIYGAYDLSAAIGQSPWHWWADAPTQKHAALYLTHGWLSPSPAVQYRGIFLNDEAPALTNWTKEKFGGYNSKFYTHVFELILRLHANFLWPAMWDAAFNEDDPLNPQLADEYGVVMSTSHHEPMLRAQQEWKRHGSGEWNYEKNGETLRKFWTEGIRRNAHYESIITLGMRGDGDMPMTEGENVSLLEKIVADQRRILAENATPELDRAPRVWALYKEVQGYYERGMRAPDDVTLLWCDDNWGDIRRLPTPEERARSGGAGVYYHFDYVGGPRNYKWINTNNLPKTWEQMNLALRYDARRIWIVNVGDLKPMEQPISFFLDMARAGEALTYADLKPWGERWAAQQFGARDAAEISSMLFEYGRLIGRRKPELTDPSTWSLTRDREAERVAAEWTALGDRAQSLAAERKQRGEAEASYFELVEHPIMAAGVLTRLHIAAASANLWAYQGRAAANRQADLARELFARDAEYADQYHKLLNGKWNHMMDQTHIGYTYWNQPPLNVAPPTSRVQPLPQPQMGLAVEGSERSLTNGEFSHHALPGVDSVQQQKRFVTLFNMSDAGTITWRASSDAPAVFVAPDKSSFASDQRATIDVDWSKAPVGRSTAHLRFVSDDGHASYTVDLPLWNSPDVSRANLEGFFESFGEVAIEAGHFTVKRDAAQRWVELPGYGETLSAMTVEPVDFAGGVDAKSSAALDYKIYFSDAGRFVADFVLAPTLNFVPGRGLRFAAQMDDGEAQVVDALARNTEADWSRAVSDGVRHAYLPVDVSAPGYHTLSLRVVDPAVVVERIVLRLADKDGKTAPATLLGPPESAHSGGSVAH